MKSRGGHTARSSALCVCVNGNNYHEISYLVGGFNPSEKYESQLGLLFPVYGKIKNDPNHQPAIKPQMSISNDLDDLGVPSFISETSIKKN